MVEVEKIPGGFLVCPSCDDGRRHDPPDVWEMESGPIPCPECGKPVLYYDENRIALCTKCRHHAPACQC